MSDWDSLYKEKGVLQKEPSVFIKKAVHFFKEQNLKKILDLGCGTGRHTFYLLKQGFEVYGCDASESALSIVRKTIPNVEFKICDMTALPYNSDSFDGIISHFVIQHGTIKIIKKAVSEMHRVLRKNGILYLSVPSTEHPEFFTGKEIEPNTKINIDAIDGDIPHHYFVEDELRTLFNKFEIIKLEHITFFSEKNPAKKVAAYFLYAKKVLDS